MCVCVCDSVRGPRPENLGGWAAAKTFLNTFSVEKVNSSSELPYFFFCLFFQRYLTSWKGAAWPMKTSVDMLVCWTQETCRYGQGQGIADGLMVFGRACSTSPTVSILAFSFFSLIFFDLSILWPFRSAWKPARVSCIPLSYFPWPPQSLFSSYLVFLKSNQDRLSNFLILHFILHSLKPGLASRQPPTPQTFPEAVQVMMSQLPNSCTSLSLHLSRPFCCIWDNLLRPACLQGLVFHLR